MSPPLPPPSPPILTLPPSNFRPFSPISAAPLRPLLLPLQPASPLHPTFSIPSPLPRSSGWGPASARAEGSGAPRAPPATPQDSEGSAAPPPPTPLNGPGRRAGGRRGGERHLGGPAAPEPARSLPLGRRLGRRPGHVLGRALRPSGGAAAAAAADPPAHAVSAPRRPGRVPQPRRSAPPPGRTKRGSPLPGPGLQLGLAKPAAGPGRSPSPHSPGRDGHPPSVSHILRASPSKARVRAPCTGAPALILIPALEGPGRAAPANTVQSGRSRGSVPAG